MSKLDQHVFLLSYSPFRLVIFLSFPEIQKRSLKQNRWYTSNGTRGQIAKVHEAVPRAKGAEICFVPRFDLNRVGTFLAGLVFVLLVILVMTSCAWGVVAKNS